MLGLNFYRLRKLMFLFPFLVVFVMVGLMMLVENVINRNACNELESQRMIIDLCSRYHRNQTFGNICPMLCDRSVFKLKYCNGESTQYKKVSVLECEGCFVPGQTSTVVLKSEYVIADIHTKLLNTMVETKNATQKVSMIEDVFRNHALEFYDSDLSDKNDLVSFILGRNYKTVVRELNTRKALDDVLQTALLLGSQDEFFSLRYLGARSYIPKLYGTCGHAYFAEFTPSLSSLNFIMFMSNWQEVFSMNPLRDPMWENRAKAALGVLKLIREVEDSYQSPMHICGVSARNFGLTVNGDAVILDTDELKFGRVVADRRCDNDGQCGHNTCHGKCNNSSRRCEKVMTSNNLQSICQKVFLTKVHRFGLLRGAPDSISKELEDVLSRCLIPEVKISKHPRENKSDRKVMEELELLLKDSLTNF